MQCPFCQIARGELKATAVFENPEIIAFRDIDPKAPTHILIIPKKHIATLNDADTKDEQLLGGMLLAASKIALQEGFHENGYRLVLNVNSDGGQTVYHIHIHLLGGRHMHWPPG